MIPFKEIFGNINSITHTCTHPWFSAQSFEIRWQASCCEYMCTQTGMQTTRVTNTPWGSLWGVTSLRESWNVIWGCGGLAAPGIRGCRTTAKGRGVSMLGHVSGISNLDPPWSAASCQILLEGEEEKEEDATPWRLKPWRNVKGRTNGERENRERQIG